MVNYEEKKKLRRRDFCIKEGKFKKNTSYSYNLGGWCKSIQSAWRSYHRPSAIMDFQVYNSRTFQKTPGSLFTPNDTDILNLAAWLTDYYNLVARLFDVLWNVISEIYEHKSQSLLCCSRFSCKRNVLRAPN